MAIRAGQSVPPRTDCATYSREMQEGCNVTGLYAGLLARALIDADQELMREFGERVAECGKDLNDQRPGPAYPPLKPALIIGWLPVRRREAEAEFLKTPALRPLI